MRGGSRPGAGRKPALDGEKRTPRTTIKATDAEWERWQRRYKELGFGTFGQFLRVALEKYDGR